jgi:hypothetical protein
VYFAVEAVLNAAGEVGAVARPLQTDCPRYRPPPAIQRDID